MRRTRKHILRKNKTRKGGVRFPTIIKKRFSSKVVPITNNDLNKPSTNKPQISMPNSKTPKPTISLPINSDKITPNNVHPAALDFLLRIAKQPKLPNFKGFKPGKNNP